jgi:phage/plasmid-like protein (TIGR03299 family)
MSMVYFGELPWSGVGTKFKEPPTTSAAIVEAAGIGWQTGFSPMYTQEHSHEDVGDYFAMYRKDDNRVLGVVNQREISVTQNDQMFNAVESLLGTDMIAEGAAIIGKGQRVFGFFKLAEKYRIEDDDVDHYVVMMNDHLKPDGKVTIVNTPIRLVCTNQLTSLLNNNIQKYRVSCTADSARNQSIASFIRDRVTSSQASLEKNAEIKLKQKITKDQVEKVLDELFPYLKADAGSSHDRANENTAMVRNTFLTKCLAAEDLANYAGTFYQMENALLDFSQHYFMSSEKGIDMERRLAEMPGLMANEKMSKYFKVARLMTA